MSDHTYAISEIVGSSPEGLDQAIRNGLKRATQTLRNADWFELVEVRGALVDGEVGHYQVRLKVGFRIEEPGK
jgi:dodecin